MLFHDQMHENLLPKDGCLYYWPELFGPSQSNHYMERLKAEIQWKPDEAKIYGKHIITRRQYAWYADRSYEYSYSGVTRHSMPWIPILLKLRGITQEVTGQFYNSCLLNLYPDGATGMAWHRDAETELLKNGSIASLSFGATRKFSLKHIASSHKVELFLHSGDLLEMCGETQSYWRHSIPKTKRVFEPRINLTFRQMRSQK